jgi:hypothetical protein
MMTTAVPGTQSREPFVGPSPFEREDQQYFFGRDRETEDLLSLVIANRISLLHAQSGAGKTSLINARLIPRLELEGFQVMPPARLLGFAPRALDPGKVENLYCLNLARAWLQTLDEAAGSEQGLDEADRPSGQGHIERLAQMSLADVLEEYRRPLDEDKFAVPRVVVLDQFEELFILYPDRSADRRGFFRQLKEALEKDRLLRALFVMREDYIAHLDPYVDLLPDKLRCRYRLEGLNRPAALSAVMKPSAAAGREFPVVS